MTSTCLLNLNEKAQRSRRNFVGRKQQNKETPKARVRWEAAYSDAVNLKTEPCCPSLVQKGTIDIQQDLETGYIKEQDIF